MTWVADYKWGDQFMPAAKAILGDLVTRHNIVVGSDFQDQVEATDIVIGYKHVAVRIRRASYQAKYGKQFTLRANRTSGTKTELAKIIDGHGDWLFYAFAVEPDQIESWVLVSLRQLRATICRKGWDAGIKARSWGMISNSDGATGLAWFNTVQIPEVVIEHSQNWGTADDLLEW